MFVMSRAMITNPHKILKYVKHLLETGQIYSGPFSNEPRQWRDPPADNQKSEMTATVQASAQELLVETQVDIGTPQFKSCGLRLYLPLMFVHDA